MTSARSSASKKPRPPRREPTQERARRTQALIFESALRLLETEGLQGFNTNRLAELSGFSVGTIYQYFDDKHELLAALARHEIGAALDAARRRTSAQHEDPASRARAAVRRLLGLFGGRMKARRELLLAALSGGHEEVIERPVRALAALLEERRYDSRARGAHRLNPDEAHVLAHAVIGPIRAALLTDPRRLRSPAFENALVRLILGFFSAPAEAKAVGAA